MSAKPNRNLARLARLARDLEQKRPFCASMKKTLDALESAGGIVAGERQLLGELETQLDGIRRALEGLESAGDARAQGECLDKVEQLLSSVEWEAAKEVASELATKGGQVEADKDAHAAQITKWQMRIQELHQALLEAEVARAPVLRERSYVARLEGQVDFALRLLRDGHLRPVSEALRRLDAEERAVEELLKVLQTKKQEYKRLEHWVELLLIRSLSEVGRVEYTVVLRPPALPGQPMIHLQGASIVVPQDDEQLRHGVDDVTAQINAGLARSFAARGLAQPDANPAAASVLRKAGDFPEGPPPSKAGDLVQQVGGLMYRLLLPEAIQAFLAYSVCPLLLTSNDLELPWELMWSGRDFLCLDRPVARMPMGAFEPRPNRTAIDRSGQPLRFLLIYADPEGDLPAAGLEVESIHDGLKQEWGDGIVVDVLKREGAQGRVLNQALLSGEYDVIHYAGHAAFNEHDPDLSGLLLSGDEVFFAQKVRRLLMGRPLVFLNACESGRVANEEKPQVVGRDFQRPAEGLASAFIYGGAAGCIGALWPVYDRPAAEFAIEFYNRVVEGTMIGEALRQARRAIRERYPDQVTWASFVLYGDPYYQLR